MMSPKAMQNHPPTKRKIIPNDESTKQDLENKNHTHLIHIQEEDDPCKKSTENNSKRTRLDIVPVDDKVIIGFKSGQRTSGLLAPTMLLTGHEAAVYSFKFDPTGKHAASSSFDRNIFLWDVYGECRNYNVLKGHKNAILEVQWNYDGSQVISASADKTIGLWDAQTGRRVKKFVGHSSIVNSCCPIRRGPSLVVSGSDDGSAKVWDVRLKRSVASYDGKYQVTAVSFTDDGNGILTGGLDGIINYTDLRNHNTLFRLQGHSDAISGISLSPNGNYLISNAMDCTLRKWDVRPFASTERCQGIFYGAQHNLDRNLIKCGWSSNGSQIISGSSDRHVYIWNAETTQLVYHLPGHSGSVNEAVFHPKEEVIIGSCSSDKNIYLGELTL